MPELPEVETTRRGVSPHIEARVLTGVDIRQAKLRWPIPVAEVQALVGERLESVTRRGKYLLLRFHSGTLIVHLGMSGSLRIINSQEPPLYHDHFDLVFGEVALRFCDPRKFGCLLLMSATEGAIEQHKLLEKLGPEPLLEEFTADYLFKKSRKRTQSLKQFLMDNHTVVGVGNIYANESLFMAGIKPTRKAGSLTQKESLRLVEKIKFVLARSIEQGGTTLRDFVGGDGKPGYFAQQLLVYGRGDKPCVNCDHILKEIRLGARSTVYCTKCQK